MVSDKLQHLDEMRGGKTVRYRRRWPKDIVDQMDSAVLTVYLKNKSGPKMVREHAAIEAMFEKTVQTMRARQVGIDARSPSQKFHEAAMKAAGMLDEVIGLDRDDQWLRGHLANATSDPIVKEVLTNPKAKAPEQACRVPQVEALKFIDLRNLQVSLKPDRAVDPKRSC